MGLGGCMRVWVGGTDKLVNKQLSRVMIWQSQARHKVKNWAETCFMLIESAASHSGCHEPRGLTPGLGVRNLGDWHLGVTSTKCEHSSGRKAEDVITDSIIDCTKLISIDLVDVEIIYYVIKLYHDICSSLVQAVIKGHLETRAHSTHELLWQRAEATLQ